MTSAKLASDAFAQVAKSLLLRPLAPSSPPPKLTRPGRLLCIEPRAHKQDLGSSLPHCGFSKILEPRNNMQMLGIYRRDCRWKKVKMARSLGQSHFARKPQHNLAGCRFRNSTIWAACEGHQLIS